MVPGPLDRPAPVTPENSGIPLIISAKEASNQEDYVARCWGNSIREAPIYHDVQGLLCATLSRYVYKAEDADVDQLLQQATGFASRERVTVSTSPPLHVDIYLWEDGRVAVVFLGTTTYEQLVGYLNPRMSATTDSNGDVFWYKAIGDQVSLYSTWFLSRFSGNYLTNNRLFLLTGHSLGACAAQYCAWQLNKRDKVIDDRLLGPVGMVVSLGMPAFLGLGSSGATDIPRFYGQSPPFMASYGHVRYTVRGDIVPDASTDAVKADVSKPTSIADYIVGNVTYQSPLRVGAKAIPLHYSTLDCELAFPPGVKTPIRDDFTRAAAGRFGPLAAALIADKLKVADKLAALHSIDEYCGRLEQACRDTRLAPYPVFPLLVAVNRILAAAS